MSESAGRPSAPVAPFTDSAQSAIVSLLAEAVALGGALPGPGSMRRVSVRVGEVELAVDWEPKGTVAPGPGSTVAAPVPAITTVPVAGLAGVANGAAATEPAPDPGPAAGAGHLDVDMVDVVTVRSPLVGTLYRAPEPGADPFVEVGATVEPGGTVAIVEAMKLMNAIVADTGGTVVEICVEDGQPVEFDQPLVRLAPANGAEDT